MNTSSLPTRSLVVCLSDMWTNWILVTDTNIAKNELDKKTRRSTLFILLTFLSPGMKTSIIFVY